MSEEPPPRPPRPMCAGCNTSKEVMQRVRIVPRRGVEPLTDEIRRAVAWPGVAMPVWVDCCGSRTCYDKVRGAAVTILAVEPTRGDVAHKVFEDKE